jgi:GR25 family glycosyltransferase involved in LPS biosynthesis
MGTMQFEKIFVVSIPSRTDRRDNMVLQAAVLNIELEFIDAPKGEEVAEKAIPMDETSEHLEGGALGCWRGHMDAIHEYATMISRYISPM